MSFDISRLQTQLNNTGLQNKNTPLYQFLNQLLNNLKNIDSTVNNVVNNPAAPITNLTQILQSIALGDDNSNNDNNDLFVPGSQSGSAQNISILFSGEVPTGLINSSNKLFTTAHTYLTGFLAPYLNGVRQLITEDYTETSPTTFTFVNAPITGDIVLVDYVQVAGISGTAGSQGIQGIQGLSGNTIFGEDGIDGQDGFSIPGSGGSGGGITVVTTTIASRPSPSSAGNLFLPSDGFNLERDSGSIWKPWGPIFPMTEPISGDFTWINQSTATLDVTNGGVYLEDLTGGSFGLKIRKKAAPATPYTIIAIYVPYILATSNSGINVGWRESSSGKLIEFDYRFLSGFPGINLAVNKQTSPTVFSAQYTSVQILGNVSPVFLKLQDTGVNRICSYSTDGQHWQVIHTVGRTDFLTADEIFFGLSVNTVAVAGTLLSWAES